MNKFKVGDDVRWVVDVDKVYSTDTKTFVGKVGKILPPQEWYDAPFGNKYLTPKGVYDVRFPNGNRFFEVGQIPESDLVKVDVEWQHPLLALFSRIYANLRTTRR